MRLDIDLTTNAPDELTVAFTSGRFHTDIREIYSRGFGADGPEDRPVEHAIGVPQHNLAPSALGIPGVTLTLRGVSRSDRAPVVFHDVLDRLLLIAGAIMELALPEGQQGQLGVLIEVDGDIPSRPTKPDNRKCTYSNVLEAYDLITGCGDPDIKALERLEAEDTAALNRDVLLAATGARREGVGEPILDGPEQRAWQRGKQGPQSGAAFRGQEPHGRD